MKFFADHASYPFRSFELWFLTEDQRCGILPPDLDTKALICVGLVGFVMDRPVTLAGRIITRGTSA